MREMKNSGVEWIGEIPADWRVIKNKYLLKFMYSGGTPSSTNSEFYCDNGIPFVSISDMSNTAFVNKTKKHITYEGLLDKNLKVLKKGTILYSIYATIGAVSELKVDAAISQAMLALSTNEDVERRYYKYNLEAMKDYVYFNANGNTQFNLNAEKVNNFFFVLPPISEQHHIADFLDEKCAKIDDVIEKQKQVIEKLKEYKLSVITEAVTKGLDPTVPIKDSGVEWIGEIPVDWELTTIARVATVVRGASPRPAGDPKYFNGNDVPWITVAEVTKDEGKYIYSTETYLTKEGALHSRLVNKGTLLLSNSGATLGVPKVTKIDGCINDGSVAFYDLKLEKFYLFYIFKARTFELRKQMQGYGQPNLNTSIIKAIELPVPSREEQKNIIGFLDKKSSEIDSVIAKKQAIVEKLTEYKKSLIYEVVTGKREV